HKWKSTYAIFIRNEIHCISYWNSSIMNVVHACSDDKTKKNINNYKKIYLYSTIWCELFSSVRDTVIDVSTFIQKSVVSFLRRNCVSPGIVRKQEDVVARAGIVVARNSAPAGHICMYYIPDCFYHFCYNGFIH
ncbi:hypothetical protein ACFKF8_004742, partial [Salmonella enterica]